MGDSNPVIGMDEPLKRKRSIRGKSARPGSISVGIALVVGSGLELHPDPALRRAKRESLATAQVFSAATSRPWPGDATAVLQAIRAIARVPGLVHAEVEDSGETLPRSGGRPARMATSISMSKAILPPRSSEEPNRADLGAGHRGRAPVGRLVLVSDTSDLFGRFGGVVLAAAVGSALAVVIGLVIPCALQRSITRPLVTLAETMAEIERNHDYPPASR